MKSIEIGRHQETVYAEIDKYLEKLTDSDREKVLENLSIDVARSSDNLEEYLTSLKEWR